MVTDRQGQLSLRCPTCRQSTLVPPTVGVSGLQSAFYIHHLLEIKDTFEMLKESKNVPCGKCIQSPQSSTCYCRDCGEFLCAVCYIVHSQWGDFANHEVVAIEQLKQKVKQLDAIKKVTLYCSLHQGKELELYCETCEELICHNCTINKHYRPEHKFDLVGDTIERHKAEIEASLEPIKMQMDSINKALDQLDLRSLELDNLQITLESSIQRQIQEFQELLEARKSSSFPNCSTTSKQKRKILQHGRRN